MSNLCKLCIHNDIPFDAQPCHSCLRLPNQPLFKLNNYEDNKCENCEAKKKQEPIEALVKYFMNCKFLLCPICNRALFDSENYCPACGQRVIKV